MRITFDEMYEVFLTVFRKTGFRDDRAALCARLFTETSLDGVQSHSVNRLEFFLDYIEKGYIKIDAEPVCSARFGPFERWDGCFGPGNLNAWFAMNRAADLAEIHGMGCVALKNTNHWMRGGTYGWQAAERNCIALLATNTIPNMPPWGSKERKIGNNPLVIAVPRKEGHIVLDMAMSQFSFGGLEKASLGKKTLPFPGGYDETGVMTDDPGKIMATGLPLPMGYWKGSGLAIMIDLMTALLSGGSATHNMLGPRDVFGPSQLFLAFSLDRLTDTDFASRLADEVIDFVHTARPAEDDGSVYYPGERTLLTRYENREKGISVNPAIWKKIVERTRI